MPGGGGTHIFTSPQNLKSKLFNLILNLLRALLFRIEYFSGFIDLRNGPHKDIWRGKKTFSPFLLLFYLCVCLRHFFFTPQFPSLSLSLSSSLTLSLPFIVYRSIESSLSLFIYKSLPPSPSLSLSLSHPRFFPLLYLFRLVGKMAEFDGH